MYDVQLHDALGAEQARYVHRTVPTATLGGLLIVGLVVVVFWPVVPKLYLYLWLAGFGVLAVGRMIIWQQYRHRAFTAEIARSWLRHAIVGAALSGLLWGAGSLFLFPAGLFVYQLSFGVTLVMMAIAGMFTYGAHYPTFLAFVVPSLFPGIFGLGLQGGTPQIAFAVGLAIMSFVALWSVRAFSNMFLETMRLRFENVALVAQLTVQKEAAESANLAKSRFLAAASHDLRQPIHALNLYLGAFTELEVPRATSLLLGKVRQCAQIMDEMFRALLDISKLDAGAIKPQISVFSLAPLLSRTRVEFEPQARAKGLDLRVMLCSAFVSSDPVLVERILRNLVSNAIRYTDRGRVVVGCRRRQNSVRVVVHDTGIGIAPREQAMVFEEFYQVGNRERDRSKGLGLGLAIVERLSKLLGTPLALKSRLGHGSLFAFDLQIAKQVDLPAIRLNRTSNAGKNLAGTLAVVVDDEELILDAARTLLEQWNCVVVAATSGAAALEQLASMSRPPDVLICDYRLRGQETGIGVVAALRDEFNAEIPALLLTGETDPDQIRTIAASGLAVLHKPLREDELGAAISALCMPHAELLR